MMSSESHNVITLHLMGGILSLAQPRLGVQRRGQSKTATHQLMLAATDAAVPLTPAEMSQGGGQYQGKPILHTYLKPRL